MIRRYVVLSLGDREAGPIPLRKDWPMHSAGLAGYLDAWHRWRAIQRDAVLNADEFYARCEARLECYAAEWRRR